MLVTPFIENCDQHGRLVADGELVISRGHGSVALEAIDPALHRVALAVVSSVELRWAATAGAEVLSVASPVGWYRDRRLDTAPAQAGTVLTGVVRLVGADLVRALAGASKSKAGHPDRFRDWLELRRVTALSGCDHHGERLLLLLHGKVDLGGQPAP